MRKTFGILISCICILWAGCGSGDKSRPLDGQIIIDPANPGSLVYNRDNDRNGLPDPFFLIGPGDPESFFYLGERQADGTRSDERQRRILSDMSRYGGNGLYIQAVRSHGGDGEDDHNPWNDPANPESGLDPEIIAQWQDWISEMEEAGIVIFFFIYDDGAHPFDDGCSDTVGSAEKAFIHELIDAFEKFPNLCWVIQEEFKFVGQTGNRRPCNDARMHKMRQLAALVKEYDDHGHLVGVHHNIDEAMAFPDDPNIDLYVQQADVRREAGRGNLDTLHRAGVPGRGFDQQHRFVYVMGEAYNWHRWLMMEGDRAMLRKSWYAAAMAGGHTLVLSMYKEPDGADPTPAMLQDMRHMQTFFESTRFNEMSPGDRYAYGDTRWVLGDPEKGIYLLYADAGNGALGIRGISKGTYNLRWFDPVSGTEYIEDDVAAAGETLFGRPRGSGPEALLYLIPADSI